MRFWSTSAPEPAACDMGDQYRAFYRNNARLFDRLAAREDYRGNLFAALHQISPLDGLRVIEFGAGTGRLTRLLTLQASVVCAFDIEAAMLHLARENLLATGLRNWSLAVADNVNLPVADASADLVIEGWSFGHTIAWYGSRWQEAADRLFMEMQRMLRPGGTAVLIETLGFGRREPLPPTAGLNSLFQHWEASQGFQRTWIRTDFQFASEAEAAELLRGFFGAELADDWLRKGALVVPECTGIWWKHKPDMDASDR